MLKVASPPNILAVVPAVQNPAHKEEELSLGISGFIRYVQTDCRARKGLFLIVKFGFFYSDSEW